MTRQLSLPFQGASEEAWEVVQFIGGRYARSDFFRQKDAADAFSEVLKRKNQRCTVGRIAVMTDPKTGRTHKVNLRPIHWS